MASNLGHTRVHGEGRRSMPGTRRYLPGRRRPPGPRGPSRGGHERGDKDPAVSLLTATLAAVRVRRVLSEERPPRADGDAKDLGTDEPTASCAAPRGTANNERAGARRAEGRGAASGSMPADGGMLVKAPRSTSAARSSRLTPMRPRWSSRWRDSIRQRTGPTQAAAGQPLTVASLWQWRQGNTCLQHGATILHLRR